MRATAALGLFGAFGAHALSFYNPDQQVLNPVSDHGVVVPQGFDIDLDDLRLVQFGEDEEPVWVTELDKIKAKQGGVKFMDITDAPKLGDGVRMVSDQPLIAYANTTRQIKKVIKTLSTDGPKENLKTFTSFTTRYYRSDTGRQSQLWLLSQIEETTAKWASESLQDIIFVSEFPHSWGQNSVLVKIAGSAPSDEGAVIISAHQDSTNMWPFLPAPGADDDGSGTVTILESYRALIAANFTPVQDVWFHWYSAEEGGLLGSQAVASDFKARKIPIKAQLQFDMTAWVKRGTLEEVGIITDFVDPKLTNFNKRLVDKYLDIPYVETKCGYACSDHASWQKAGYRASFSIESSFENSNKHIHSSSDRYDISPEFSFTHMLEFSKLAVAFLVELGGWSA